MVYIAWRNGENALTKIVYLRMLLVQGIMFSQERYYS